MFVTYDTNGDGDLQPHEFEVFYKDFMKITCDEEPSISEIQGAIIELDLDGNGEISLSEFTTWWTNLNRDRDVNVSEFVSYAGAAPPPLPPRRSCSSNDIKRVQKVHVTKSTQNIQRKRQNDNISRQRTETAPPRINFRGSGNIPRSGNIQRGVVGRGGNYIPIQRGANIPSPQRVSNTPRGGINQVRGNTIQSRGVPPPQIGQPLPPKRDQTLPPYLRSSSQDRNFARPLPNQPNVPKRPPRPPPR